MNLHNKIVLITGGSRGLGRSSALHLAKSGADLVLTYREKKTEGEQVASEIRALGRKAVLLQLDVADTKQFNGFRDRLAAALKETFGREQFDVLINNAGNMYQKVFENDDEAAFDTLFNVHFKGVFFLTRRLLPLIANGGKIINTSSGLARTTVPGYEAYASMKGAVETFTRYLAKELGPRKIAVNVIAPGITETDLTKDTSLSKPGSADMFAKVIAMGRVGQPEDIARVVTFLASDEAGWMTAQRVEASGGQLL